MRTELEERDIELIAKRVLELLKPMLNGNSDEDSIFDTQGLAEYLRVTPSWLDQNRRKLNIPHFKLGAQIRYRRKDIDTWLRAQG